MVSERLKILRAQSNMSQTDVANKLGITRSSVNAWEMGLSVPLTRYIVDLAKLFRVSTDYLLGVSDTSSISLDGLSEQETKLIYSLLNYMQGKK